MIHKEYFKFVNKNTHEQIFKRIADIIECIFCDTYQLRAVILM